MPCFLVEKYRIEALCPRFLRPDEIAQNSFVGGVSVWVCLILSVSGGPQIPVVRDKLTRRSIHLYVAHGRTPSFSQV